MMETGQLTNKRWFSWNPLGTIINLAILYNFWWMDTYARSKFLAISIILTQITLIAALPPVLAILYWQNFVNVG